MAFSGELGELWRGEIGEVEKSEEEERTHPSPASGGQATNVKGKHLGVFGTYKGAAPPWQSQRRSGPYSASVAENSRQTASINQ